MFTLSLLSRFCLQKKEISMKGKVCVKKSYVFKLMPSMIRMMNEATIAILASIWPLICVDSFMNSAALRSDESLSTILTSKVSYVQMFPDVIVQQFPMNEFS